MLERCDNVSSSKKARIRIEAIRTKLNNTVEALAKYLKDHGYKDSLDSLDLLTEMFSASFKDYLPKDTEFYPMTALRKVLDKNKTRFSTKELENYYLDLVRQALKKGETWSYDELQKSVRDYKNKKIFYYFGIKHVYFADKQNIVLTDDIRVTSFSQLKLQFKSKKDIRYKYLSENNVLLEVRVDGGDNPATLKKAEDIAKQVLNLLNYLAGLDHAYISLNRTFEVDSVYLDYENITVPRDGDLIGISSQSNKYSEKPYLALSEKVLSKYKFLFESGLSEKENQIKLALFWMDRAVHDQSDNTGFLELMIALEAITEQKGDHYMSPSISYQISLICAYLIEENLDDRKDTIKQVKKFYGLRSKIVHGEVTKSANTVDVDGIPEYVKAARAKDAAAAKAANAASQTDKTADQKGKANLSKDKDKEQKANNTLSDFEQAYQMISKIIEKYLFSNEYKNLKSLEQIWEHVQDSMLDNGSNDSSTSSKQ